MLILISWYNFCLFSLCHRGGLQKVHLPTSDIIVGNGFCLESTCFTGRERLYLLAILYRLVRTNYQLGTTGRKGWKCRQTYSISQFMISEHKKLNELFVVGRYLLWNKAFNTFDFFQQVFLGYEFVMGIASAELYIIIIVINLFLCPFQLHGGK